MPSLFQLHKQKWESCRLCPLCEARNKVVLMRGTARADILFVGEAPGLSENALGVPFVGPAGALLNHIISESLNGHSYALTNLVACIPLGSDGDKVSEPPEESVKVCSSRLLEFLDICKPRLIVTVGKLADKWVKRMHWEGRDDPIQYCSIAHPARILRADISQRGLLIQRCIVTIVDAVDELNNA